MNRLLAFLAALAFTVSPLLAGPVLSFTSHTGSFTDGTNRVIGWDFTTGSTPVSATALSFFDDGQNGLAPFLRVEAAFPGLHAPLGPFVCRNDDEFQGPRW